ncbi:hypothetical protein ABW20_dc0104147 [Dactylellina cionopaga]|nr:hypothetical protein ABW20_dc0104147 [Dactylellina cionopaga]
MDDLWDDVDSDDNSMEFDDEMNGMNNANGRPEDNAIASNGDNVPTQPTNDSTKAMTLELELYKLLKNTSNYQGSFAFSSTYPVAPNPGLKIEGFHESGLRLPVSSDDAAKLSDLGKASPFGKGEQTLVDAKVRSSRQVDPSQIEFENPGFSEWLHSQVLTEIITTLGIDSDTKPKLSLYKLLVYEKGDHFKAHRDTPKEEGMIGTVVVILPSVFEGGAIKLSHGGEDKTFDFAPNCKFNMGVAAWYSDVEHAVDEVIDGYRVALIYNLVVEGGALSAENTTIDPELLKLLQRLKSGTDPIAYSLINKYSLSQRRLGFKGQDRYIISNLVAAINKIGGIALCCGDIDVKRSEFEDDMDEDDEDTDEDSPPNFAETQSTKLVDVTLKNIEHLAGTYRHFAASKVAWTRKLYSLGPTLDELMPTHSEEEYTGNEGTTFHTC